MLLKDDENGWVYHVVHTAVVAVGHVKRSGWGATVALTPYHKISNQNTSHKHTPLHLGVHLTVAVRIMCISGKVASFPI